MKNVSPEFAEILGLLCAEGSHIISYVSYWGKDKGKPRYHINKKSERIEFYNKDLNLLKHYQWLLKKEFNYNPKITKHNKINIGIRKIIKEIVDHTALGHMNWKVPDAIINSDDDLIKYSFLRGYFDGDGTVSNSARMFSCNKNGLNQVSLLLSNLNIQHTFQGPVLKEKRKPNYVLYIKAQSKERFLKNIKPISKRPVAYAGVEI